MNGDLIEQFVDEGTLQAMASLLDAADEAAVNEAGVKISASFDGGSGSFGQIALGNGEEKLVSSFHNNLVLLIEKTWVEKSDVALKAQVLYRLEEFTKFMGGRVYSEAYSYFFNIVDDVVYLMFGAQTKSKSFDEYAMRIDPDFGLFWWYVESLPRDAAWEDRKKRLVILLGMYYLANF
ncbi:MAG: hypothetical protein K6G18_03895 [Treponema sp.]|nr:hypothetical protein [Treponema sp.]MCR5620976.1 hypothetical protein [Treponema sp.]